MKKKTFVYDILFFKILAVVENPKSNDIGLSLYSNKNLNISKSCLTEQKIENQTRSPVLLSHCGNDDASSKAHTCNNFFGKQLTCSSSRSHSNIIKEKIDTYSAPNIQSSKIQNGNVDLLKVNNEQKDTDSKIKSPQVKRLLILPTTTNSYGQKIHQFFWLDAYEDPYTDPGVVFLFGKIFEPVSKKYISCCVTVKNVPRRIYVLPRKNVSLTHYISKFNIIQNTCSIIFFYVLF